MHAFNEDRTFYNYSTLLSIIYHIINCGRICV